ncbi:serpin-ZX-like [Papaver somniferum]|uniref:serpin-ZX-like n=1 Tax=Papaver somniferum TaxID=3469 RepID=UPI000E701C59|nr:serpin-ZX-like [Papaver somniferum]
MYIVLPDQRDGLGGLIEKLSSNFAGFMDQHISVNHPYVPIGQFKIPKFSIHFDFEVSRVLKEFGVVMPFDESKAQLTEMVNIDDPSNEHKLHVSNVFHKFFVEIDEKGTKAAASTGIQLATIAAIRPPPHVDFIADHPFMFIIKEQPRPWISKRIGSTENTGVLRIIVGRANTQLSTVEGMRVSFTRHSQTNTTCRSTTTTKIARCPSSFKVLRLLYQSRTRVSDRYFSMYMVLPEKRDGLGELIENVSSDSAGFLDEHILVNHPYVPTGQFKIPKFSIHFDFEVSRVLKEFGVVMPFDESKHS